MYSVSEDKGYISVNITFSKGLRYDTKVQFGYLNLTALGKLLAKQNTLGVQPSDKANHTCENMLRIIMSFKELKYFPQSFWSHLPVCNAASDWPQIFYAQVFLFSISATIHRKLFIATYIPSHNVTAISESLWKSIVRGPNYGNYQPAV